MEDLRSDRVVEDHQDGQYRRSSLCVWVSHFGVIVISEEIGVNKNVSNGFYYNGDSEGQTGEKVYGVGIMKDKELKHEENDKVSQTLGWVGRSCGGVVYYGVITRELNIVVYCLFIMNR